MIKFLERDTVEDLTADADKINAAYLEDLREQLGRAPGETLDSVVDVYTGKLLRPADRVITTRAVPVYQHEGRDGGVMVVPASVEKYLDARLASDLKERAELSAKAAETLEPSRKDDDDLTEALEVSNVRR